MRPGRLPLWLLSRMPSGLVAFPALDLLLHVPSLSFLLPSSLCAPPLLRVQEL